MTENEKYITLLCELAEVIAEKNSKIDIYEWQIKVLEQKLAEAEASSAERGKES